jgi:hypothetical protein
LITLLSSELDGPVDLLELVLLILCRLDVDELVSLLLEVLAGERDVATAKTRKCIDCANQQTPEARVGNHLSHGVSEALAEGGFTSCLY